MARDFIIKQNDTTPSLSATLLDKDGAVSLTTATSVRFIMTNVEDALPTVNDDAVIVSASAGTVRYDWVTGDTDVVGIYNAEFEVTYTGGKTRTFPGAGYLRIEIVKDLA